MALNQVIENDESLILAKAYETNLTAYTIAVAEAGCGFVQRTREATLTAIPYTYWINGVVSPRLPTEGTLESVNQILSVFRELGREVWFTLGPSTNRKISPGYSRHAVCGTSTTNPSWPANSANW